MTDPTKFAFFKGLNDPAQDGILSATVPGGLPAGVYKVRLQARRRRDVLGVSTDAVRDPQMSR